MPWIGRRADKREHPFPLPRLQQGKPREERRMKKKHPTKKQKIVIKTVYENPLDWCPLFGCIPDTNEELFSKHPMSGNIGSKLLVNWCSFLLGEITEQEFLSADKQFKTHNGGYKTTCISSFDAAEECKEYIHDARELWGVRNNLFSIEAPLPDIEERAMKEKSTVARTLFKSIHRLAWNGEPFSYNIERYTQFTSTLLPSGVNIFSRDAVVYLDNARLLTNKEICLHEIFALFVIFESWILWINILKTSDNLEKEKYFHKQTSYILKLLHAAKKEREKKTLEIEKNNIEKTALPLIKEKEAQISRGKSLGHIRQSLIGVQLAVKQLKEKTKKERRRQFNDKELYKHIFKNHCVNNDLIAALCSGEDVNDKFIECEDSGNTYYVFMLPDLEKPEDHLAAYLCQIQEGDRDEMGKTMKTMKYNTYRSEYFYKKNTSRRGGKTK